MGQNDAKDKEIIATRHEQSQTVIILIVGILNLSIQVRLLVPQPKYKVQKTGPFTLLITRELDKAK